MHPCMWEDLSPATLSCTGTPSDLTLTVTASLAPLASGCSSPSGVVSIIAYFVLTAQNNRYDIGLFIAQGAGQASALQGICAVASLPPTPSASSPTQGLAIDGDACGDISGPSSITWTPSVQATVPCSDNGSGALRVQYCYSWSPSAGVTCQDPLQALPGTFQRCHCTFLDVAEISVPPCEFCCQPHGQIGSDVVLPCVQAGQVLVAGGEAPIGGHSSVRSGSMRDRVWHTRMRSCSMQGRALGCARVGP
eukprot:jgi/Mesvir1/17337/Mv07732-RA.1